MPTLTQEIPSFESFYAEYIPLVQHVLSRIKGHAAYRDDLVQETFVRAWKNYDTLDHSQNVRAWIGRIAHQVACNFLRRTLPHLQGEIPLETAGGVALSFPEPWSAGQFALAEASSAIARTYAQLPEEDQRVLDLLVQEYQAPEIAEVLHLDEKACNTRMKRARRRFRRAYAHMEGDEA